MKSRNKKSQAIPVKIEHCSYCKKEFKSNNGLTIRHGEYLSSGLKWFCNEICSENYINENGY